MPIFKRTFSQDLDLQEQHLNKDILSRTDCTTTLTDLRTKFENAFHSEIRKSVSDLYKIMKCSIIYDAMVLTWTSLRKYMLELISSSTTNSTILETKEVDTNTKRSYTSNSSIECYSLKFKFINSKFTLDYDSQMTDKYFVEYTGIEVKHFRETLLQHMSNVKKSVAERTRHQRQHDRRVNKRHLQTKESKIDSGKAVVNGLVVMESNGTELEVQDDSNRSGNDTDADDADIRPIYDEEPMDEYPEQCQVKSHMLDSSPDNQTTDYSKQSLEFENILLKNTVAQFQKDFSRMEAHCIPLELKYQNQSLKSGRHGDILNERSNKAKIKKEIDAYETICWDLLKTTKCRFCC
ncbi:hypothetical protein Tco_1138736 [Tanacetum coccineum]